MATTSKLGDLYGLSKEGLAALFWSGLALFFDGLFWRVLLAVGRAFKFLGALIDEFYAVARHPPPFQELPPPLEPLPYPIVDAVKVDDGYQRPRPAVGLSSSLPKHELERRPVHRPPASNDLYWAAGRGNTNTPPHNPFGPIEPSAPIYVPHFQCEVYCHRTWRKYYAVVSGRQPGIYNCWDCAKVQVDRFSGHDHKSFPTMAGAEEYFGVSTHCIVNHQVLDWT